MALLGLISLAQIWFIPGLLLLYRITGISALDKLLLAVPLSAVTNFFLVYLLVALGAYSQLTLLAVLGLEIIGMAYLVWCKQAHTATSKPVTITFDKDLTNAIFILVLLAFGIQAFNQIGTVFTQGDAVSSWNPWAVSWYQGFIPHHIWWYPQLLPALYSITYQFIADSRVELFAKIAESFLPLFALAMSMRMAILLPSERKKILWSAIIFFLLVRRLWGSESAVNGYADFPLAYFCITIVYVFVLQLSQQNKKESHSSSLSMILVGVTCAACLTKHSGLYLGALTPFFWLAYFHDTKPFKTRFRQSALIGIAIATICASWYLYQAWRISMGTETSNLKFLTEIIHLTWYQSIAFGFMGVTHKLSWLWVILLLASLAHLRIRYVTVFAVAPLFLLWAAFIPYDYRNLAPIFPLLAISLSYGGGELLHFASSLPVVRTNLKLLQRGSLLLIALVLGLALSDSKLNPGLLSLSEKGKSQLGDPEINSRLMAYFEFNPEPSLVATPYHEMALLPNIAQHYTPLSCGQLLEFGVDKAPLEKILSQLSDPTIKHVLLLPWCDPDLLDYFTHHPEKFHPVFKHEGSTFYELQKEH